ncbi:MAG: hypothetical protein A2Y62_20110 [Candidatus Fischerbacteria bacterium RBG_13_37_8]|uniref:ABC transporter domain-containing protein n=1 Tax=Candidatus Fischerbacteria bacterium RBG_13_37_8 TaxID=1817863 RepID=A0A1F5VTA3_9BACT|nr:MAG: hypothetical protein A2Y62_20110 [Candidatus Fischerbacteria bacterium RBG_13_37_8]
MAKVSFEGVTKTFIDGTLVAVNNATLVIPDGKFITILGPSGCGKSTLLRLAAGLESPDSGTIYIGEQNVNALSPRQRDIAMVFQNYALYPHMTIQQNISIGLKLRGIKSEEIDQQVNKVTSQLSIEETLKRYPAQLSGGQQQRVALARAIVRNPAVFLLDEPLSNLDAALRETMRAELKNLFKMLNATVMYVTHDQIEALSMSDTVVIMDKGLIRQIDPPAVIYEKPAHIFVAEFVGSPRMNIIKGKIENDTFTSLDTSITFPIACSNKQVFLGIRPESLSAIKISGTSPDKHLLLTGTVTAIELLGSQYLLTVTVGNTALRVITPQADTLIQKTVTLFCDYRHLHFFEEQTGLRLTG